MKTYVCIDLYVPTSGYPICKEWVEYNSFLNELSNLSYQQAGLLLSMTVALFATAWVWRFLSKQAFR